MTSAPRERALGALLAAILIVASSSASLAQPPAPVANDDPLAAANRAFDTGDFATAELAARRALTLDLEKVVRAEAWRLVGLSLFYMSRYSDADAALFNYLKLDTEAQLDPALHPPEAVVFFASVRSNHQAELDGYRPKREQRRFILTLAPPFGQFQNKHRNKGIVLAVVGLSLAAGNIGSYLVLRRWCESATNVCEGRESGARTLRAVNIGLGIALIGTYAFGVFDAVHHYRRWKRDENSLRGSLTGYVVPTGSGVAAGLSLRF